MDNGHARGHAMEMPPATVTKSRTALPASVGPAMSAENSAHRVMKCVNACVFRSSLVVPKSRYDAFSRQIYELGIDTVLQPLNTYTEENVDSVTTCACRYILGTRSELSINTLCARIKILVFSVNVTRVVSAL